MRWNWPVLIPVVVLGVIFLEFHNIGVVTYLKPRTQAPHRVEHYANHSSDNGTGLVDSIADHIRSCVPFYDLIQNHTKAGTGRRQQPFLSMSLVGAYAFPDYSAVTTEADGRFGQLVYCRYLDVNLNEIKPPVESVVFPEFTVYCCRRSQAHYMSITTFKDEEINETVLITDRTVDDPTYTLSMCVKPIYGSNAKFLLLADYIEHYKLQGVQHFYIYVKDVHEYTDKLIKQYVKSGEAEVVYFREKQDRPSIEWHLVGTQVKLMTENKNIGMIRFVTQYVLKNGTDPVVYEGEKTLKEHLPTLVYHNSSSPARIGYTAKCIIDPRKIFLMWVHHVEIFPGYNGYEVPVNEGIIRHYRDIITGDWYKHYLPEVEGFGPFQMTDYPRALMEPLYRNVKTKLDFVYKK